MSDAFGEGGRNRLCTVLYSVLLIELMHSVYLAGGQTVDHSCRVESMMAAIGDIVYAMSSFVICSSLRSCVRGRVNNFLDEFYHPLRTLRRLITIGLIKAMFSTERSIGIHTPRLFYEALYVHVQRFEPASYYSKQQNENQAYHHGTCSIFSNKILCSKLDWVPRGLGTADLRSLPAYVGNVNVSFVKKVLTVKLHAWGTT